MLLKYGDKETVLENRKRFLEKNKVGLEDCVITEVEHEDKIVEVGQKDRGRGVTNRESVVIGETFITSESGVVLFLMTADCFPIAFYDPMHKVIALSHLGWKPTDLRLVEKTIAYL